MEEINGLARLMEKDQKTLALTAGGPIGPQFSRTGNPNDWDEVAQIAERGQKAATSLQKTEAAQKLSKIKETAEKFSGQYKTFGGVIFGRMEKQLLSAEKVIAEWEKEIATDNKNKQK